MTDGLAARLRTHAGGYPFAPTRRRRSGFPPFLSQAPPPPPTHTHLSPSVSLLTAALLLKPTSIYYHRTAPWAGTSCEAQLGQCFSGLGIRITDINKSEPNSSFGHATWNFRLRPSFADMGRIHGVLGRQGHVTAWRTCRTSYACTI